MSEVSSQTLHIVARELASELNEARAALEAFGEQQENVDLLRKCAERLHSVHGALRVAEVYGAALLAEEMEQGTSYLVENFDEKRHLAEGLDALMRAMVQLPTYLERVMSGGRDMALVLLPLLNDLRAVRGHALLSEGTLLLLNLTSDQQASPSPAVPGETALTVAQWARKLRTRFQLGLLGWIKGDRVEQNLEILSRAAEKLEQVATTQPVFQLYWVVGAVLEGLREGGLDGSASIKRLLGQADREMRRLYESGEGRYAESPPVDLMNNLLYYVARTRSNGPRVSAVRASFRLNELLPVDEQVEQARESLAAPSVKLMKTVAAAIKEDLSKVKDALDIFVRKGATEPDELHSQLELLRKIGDTLGVLGLGDLREKVQVEANDLQGIIAQRTAPSEGTLLRMAATLIRIEDSLDEQLIGLIVPTQDDSRSAAAPKGDDDVEFRHVTEAVLRECIVNMARIKESIALSVEKPRESQTTEQIPALIRGITAGLLMLGKTRAVEITEGIAQALHKYVRPDGVGIVQEAVDRLADAIVAVEYYMETLQAGRSDPWYMLDNAETCLRFLNEIDPVALPTPSVADQDPIRTMVIEPMAAQQAAATQHERTAVLTASLEPHMVPAGAKAPPPASAQAAAIVKPDVDPEFIELFIEEAKDEITRLQEFFPRWDDNPQDTEALTHVRRSFHTLKGSGRMVGAVLIGDFAWSIENLLNRVINKTLDRTPDMMTVLRIAVGAVPQLVEQLETNRAPETDVMKLMAKANEIAGVKETPAAPTNTPVAQAAPAPKPAPQPMPAAHSKPAPAANDLSPPTLTEHVPPLMATGKYPRSTPSSEPRVTSTSTVTARQSSLTNLDQTANTALVKKLEDELAAELGLGDTQSVALRPGSIESAAGVATLEAPVEEAIELSSELGADDDVFADASPTSMDPVLHEIFAKETAGHLAEVRRFIANCEQAAPPYPVTEALHRACHTLSGTAKTAGARQSIKIAEPLNSYVRKLFDYGLPMPPAGLAALKDAVNAMNDVITHIDEHTGYFSAHPGLSARLTTLDQALDTKIAQLAPESDAANNENSASLPVLVETPELRDALAQSSSAHGDVNNEEETITTATLTSGVPAFDPKLEITQTVAAPPDLEALERGDDVVELPATDAKELDTFTLRALRAQMGVLDPSTSMEEALVDSTRRQQALRDPAIELADQAALEQPANEEVIELSGEIQDDDSPTDLGNHIDVTDETLTAHDDLVLTSDSVIERVDEAQLIQEQELSRDEDVVLSSDVAISNSPSAVAPVVIAEEAEEEGESEDFDPDVAAIFTEEATELLETAETSLAAWIRDRANNALVFELKRALHTLKGGARMAGLRAMGDLSHELESFMQNVESGLVPAEPRAFEALQASLDELHKMRDAVSNGQRCRPAKQLMARIRALSRGEEPPPEVETPVPAPAPVHAPIAQQPAAPEALAPAVAPVVVEAVDAKIEDTGEIEVEFSPEELQIDSPASAVQTAATAETDAVSEPGAPIALPPGREQPQQQERQEFARVDADLLDNLLNNAGEVSIFRSRLEQQVSSIEFNLAELGRTVTRLKEQLRKLELETEAQILHKHQDESTHRAEFDPLELDRYSSIQQLSRALAESVSDVGSIEGLLEHLTREAQNLLLQQSRVVTELQGGLMRTRMVPFQRHVQRLTRLVRQVATDTNKRCELVVEGASGELDRQVLERMLPPFEHMLRNSVVHGIETPDERAAKGKPESGTITVGLHREGSEMVIVLQDDGRGIDVKAVRERAVQRGILQPGKVLTDEEALQLVLEPGFSTASSVTQHAGRGVGMDVVVNEIKKLGGVLFTESKPNQGVKFTIRLPFTLAIAQSLIVRVGEELYALPLSSVEGVARVSRDEVHQHLSEEQPSFNYGGQIYRFQHLGSFIGAGPSVLPDADDVSVPVVLIRAGEHSTALVMDELVGSREMVVKSVGPQIATIRGIAGATILGDGRIVIILDMGALVRSEWRARGPMESQPAQDKRTFALVVDDSITVRRVTQRFLERNGMRVMTAKDGIDAWSILQDHLPDVILLDIEMPRMDGYELAAQVRNDARLGEIPIVMITSRVGEKHRARAIELGVNDYLGKPYQENELLDAIEPLVEARRRATEHRVARSL